MLNYNAAILNAVALHVGNERFRELSGDPDGNARREDRAEELGFLQAIATIYGVQGLQVHQDYKKALAPVLANIEAAKKKQQ